MKKSVLCALAFLLVFSVFSVVADPALSTLFGNQAKPPATLLTGTKTQSNDSTAMFQNFDQKSTQLFNILSTVLKNVKDMQSAAVRNVK